MSRRRDASGGVALTKAEHDAIVAAFRAHVDRRAARWPDGRIVYDDGAVIVLQPDVFQRAVDAFEAGEPMVIPRYYIPERVRAEMKVRVVATVWPDGTVTDGRPQ